MYKLLDGRDWPWEKLGLALVGRALLSIALILSSADGWGCTPSQAVGSCLTCGDSALGSPGSMVGLVVNPKSVYAKRDLPGLQLPEPPYLW